MTKYDMYLWRRYITELEFDKASFEITKQKLTIVENQRDLWKETSSNLEDQLSLTNNALDKQIELQEFRDKQVEDMVKMSQKKGIKKGAVVGAVATLLICLLVK